MDQNELKSLLTYDPSTGMFTWKQARGPIKAGSVAGTVHPVSGYIVICISKKNYKAHRLAWLYVFGEEPEKFIDHINGDKADNRISNIRLATKSQNGMNVGIRSNNTSGHKGVSFCKQTGRWQSVITINRKAKRLGRFDTKEEAAAAYEDYAERNQGKFYRDPKHRAGVLS